jgi:hypothetical protein
MPTQPVQGVRGATMRREDPLCALTYDRDAVIEAAHSLARRVEPVA